MTAPRVAEIMTPDPIALHGHDSLGRAAEEMELSWVRHLPVVDREGILLGLLSHRDLLAARDLERRVDEVMITDVKTVAPDTPAHEAAYLILHHKIGCVPVTDAAGRLLGIVTESDFVRVAHALLGGRVSVEQLELEEHEDKQL